MSRCGQLIMRLKYEQLSSEPYYFSIPSYNEAERDLEAWMKVSESAAQVYDSLSESTQYPFFEVSLDTLSL